MTDREYGELVLLLAKVIAGMVSDLGAMDVILMADEADKRELMESCLRRSVYRTE